MHVSSLVKIPWHLLKLSSRNKKNIGVSRADNSVTIWRNLPISNPKPDFHNINAHTKFGENPLMFTQVIIRKRNINGRSYKMVFVRLSHDLSLNFSNPKVQIFNTTMSTLTPQWSNKCNEPHNVKFYLNPNPRMSCGHVQTDRQTSNEIGVMWLFILTTDGYVTFFFFF